MPGHPVILVVEDDSNDAILLALRPPGSAAILNFVQDGPEAVRYLQGNGLLGKAQFPFPNMFLVDLRLPGMSGFELLDWVRRQPALNQMLVGVLSGLEHLPDIQEAYALGAKFYITKPSSNWELVEIARRLTEDCMVGFETVHNADVRVAGRLDCVSWL